MRFKLTIEYAGTRYSGWQIQKNARTVQGEIQRAIGAATGARDFELYGSGPHGRRRSRARQVAHLDLTTYCRPDAALRRINDELPADINILRIQKVRHTFHARHGARGRSYLYQVARRRTAFAKPFVWWVKELSTSPPCGPRETARRHFTTSARSPTKTRSRSRRR